MELLCSVQKYHWGRKGRDSLVAQLSPDNINEKEHFAELWMGTHPNGPTKLKHNHQTLSTYVFENPKCLGSKVSSVFGETLPFLFKVLSVETALSVQAHPSKTLAQELFEKHPDVYKDGNHKPEMAIALTPFHVLSGFRPLVEIQKFVKGTPELMEILGPDVVERFVGEESGLVEMKSCFEQLMFCDSKTVQSVVDKIQNRLECSSIETKEEYQFELFTKLNCQYPGDVGVLCVYWLNYLVLDPGQALFMAQNEPHAYIFGDCIECMANSDNVVRAGLTPKYRDVKTLCSMLTYKHHQIEEIIFRPEAEDECCLLFNPPVADFAVARYDIPAGRSYYMRPKQSASIAIVIEGGGHILSALGTVGVQKGSVLFLPADQEMSVDAKTNVLMFQAFCNV